MKVIITKDYEALSELSAGIIIDFIKKNSRCVLGLATGSTPVGMYKVLIDNYKEKLVDFSNITTFNLDEYMGLDKNHPQSYNYFMNHNLFNHINVDYDKIHIPNGMAENIEDECSNYDKMVADAGGIDIQILGIGNNGHIGFNEPSKLLNVGTHITTLSEDTIKANSRFFESEEEVPTKAITMGMGGIMKAKHIVLLATGSSKAKIISKLVDGKIDTYIPASLLQIHRDVTVIVDEACGALLKDAKFSNEDVSITHN